MPYIRKYADISFDPAKREWTLRNRGLDLADAPLIFAGEVRTALDDRRDYGEDRYITAGVLRERLVVVVWTPRGTSRHIISMRYCHEREARYWRGGADGSR
jgi:uncharacterized DUF497 family protein